MYYETNSMIKKEKKVRINIKFNNLKSWKDDIIVL